MRIRQLRKRGKWRKGKRRKRSKEVKRCLEKWGKVNGEKGEGKRGGETGGELEIEKITSLISQTSLSFGMKLNC